VSLTSTGGHSQTTMANVIDEISHQACTILTIDSVSNPLVASVYVPKRTQVIMDVWYARCII